MEISLGTRTADTVRTYFEKVRNPVIKAMLPQKAATVEEALKDYEDTLLPDAASYGRTILADGIYVGDIWCYCIDPDEDPNAMLSFCVFDESVWNKGIATTAARLFLHEACARYGLKTVGAFCFSDNTASIRVLEKTGFCLIEEFMEDGRLSRYYQYEKQDRSKIMLRLEKVNGKNVWDILKLKVSDSQKDFVARNDISIIEAYTAINGNGYAFPFGIYEEDTPVGFLMIGYDTDDYWDDAPEIARGNYNLWRLMIDEKYQGKGYGKEAVRLALDFINTFPCGGADCCWLSYEPENEAARKLYNSFGFEETGEYDGEEVIAVLKLADNPGMNHTEIYQDVLTSDFSDTLFQNAFKQYFSELGIQVKDWDGLFREMNEEGGNEAYIRIAADGSIIGFIMFKPIPFSSWFFEETGGFIREFWIAEAYRSQRHGSDLLKLAEDRLAARDIHMILLTSDTAEQFYLRHGFQKAPGMKAKNDDPVFIKRI